MGLGLLSVLVAFSLNTSWALDKASSGTPADSLSITPIDGHSLFNDSADQARSSIDMYMFHLSENGSIQHLIQAQQRGVKVRIILDKKTLEGAKAKAIFTQLQQAGISARASSEGFSITHAKAAVFDNSWSLVTSINLTNTDQYTRDFGIKTYDTDVRDEIEKVFAADWDNATNGTINTPDLSVQKLVWSPVNSKNKIISFIQSARSSIELEVENLGDEDVIAALKERAQQQVKVTVIVPACVEGSGLRNLPYMKDLASGGVDARF
ncbi:MAG TPA: phospholipase D-like domain-containing protein, partial [Bdellovibrio sp.]|nr:phospholipase D-like domain-containing protein [Bdellovibrio sp.]